MMPSLFLSHGSPVRVLTDHPANQFLRRLASFLPQRPDGILVISAHWQSPEPTLTATGRHRTLHDFAGFPHRLYDIEYPAEQPSWLTTLIEQTCHKAGLDVLIQKRPLDHGAWTVLQPAFPDADIPVAALSLPEYSQMGDYVELGKALAPLRERNILIIGSGSATHNLYRLSQANEQAAWAETFVGWLQKAVEHTDLEALSRVYESSPCAEIAHPSSEHYAPLLVALGAASPARSTLLHDSYEMGTLNNSSWLFVSDVTSAAPS